MAQKLGNQHHHGRLFDLNVTEGMRTGDGRGNMKADDLEEVFTSEEIKRAEKDANGLLAKGIEGNFGPEVPITIEGVSGAGLRATAYLQRPSNWLVRLRFKSRAGEPRYDSTRYFEKNHRRGETLSIKRISKRRFRIVSVNDKPVTAAARHKELNENDLIESVFEEDLKPGTTKKSKHIQNVYKRNAKAVKKLKKIYKKCQISGTEYAFAKKNGDPYLEGHHLVPLGEGGADSPENIVVVSAHVHRMLHHAKVSAIDLSKIKGNKLTIEINGKPHTIQWHPKHAKLVKAIAKG